MLFVFYLEKLPELGGLMTDWGVHEIDIALFGMKVKEPKSIVASGGRFGYPNQATKTPSWRDSIQKGVFMELMMQMTLMG